MYLGSGGPTAAPPNEEPATAARAEIAGRDGKGGCEPNCWVIHANHPGLPQTATGIGGLERGASSLKERKRVQNNAPVYRTDTHPIIDLLLSETRLMRLTF